MEGKRQRKLHTENNKLSARIRTILTSNNFQGQVFC